MSAEWLMLAPVLKIEDIVMKENEIKAKAEAIAGQLTLEEKIGIIHGSHLFATKGVERLGIPPLVMSDGPMGCGRNSCGDGRMGGKRGIPGGDFRWVPL